MEACVFDQLRVLKLQQHTDRLKDPMGNCGFALNRKEALFVLLFCSDLLHACTKTVRSWQPYLKGPSLFVRYLN